MSDLEKFDVEKFIRKTIKESYFDLKFLESWDKGEWMHIWGNEKGLFITPVEGSDE